MPSLCGAGDGMRTSCILGMHSTNWEKSPALCSYFPGVSFGRKKLSSKTTVLFLLISSPFPYSHFCSPCSVRVLFIFNVDFNYWCWIYWKLSWRTWKCWSGVLSCLKTAGIYSHSTWTRGRERRHRTACYSNKLVNLVLVRSCENQRAGLFQDIAENIGGKAWNATFICLGL